LIAPPPPARKSLRPGIRTNGTRCIRGKSAHQREVLEGLEGREGSNQELFI
jgi:hypothetical protein